MTVLKKGDVVYDNNIEAEAEVIDTNYRDWDYWLIETNGTLEGGIDEEYAENNLTVVGRKIPQFCEKHGTELMYDEDEEWRCIFCEYV